MRKIFKNIFVALALLCLWVYSLPQAKAMLHYSLRTHTEALYQEPAEKTVKGTVLDEQGQPAVAATVKVLTNPSKGATTNLEGQFVIHGVKNSDILSISYIGYQTQEVKVGEASEFKIQLKVNQQLLDEVVVVGYATQKKVNVTGAVSTVSAKQIESRPVQNVVQALQGTVPGLNTYVGNGGGALGASLGFNIRGGGTIGTGSTGAPLVLIDGVEGSLNGLNPNDVENISVLKDAASSSIYGARAAFGVILVTTKSGKSGKTHINYLGNVRWNTATQVPDMVNSLDFATYFNQAQMNNDGTVIFNDDALKRIEKFINKEYTDPKKPEYYGTVRNDERGMWQAYVGAFANTNWFNEFYKKNVPSYEHNLSVSGGVDKYNYLISLGALDQNGLIRHGKDTYQRLTLNAKFSVKMYDWLRVNLYSKISHVDYQRPQYLDVGGLFYHNIARRWPTNPNYVFDKPMHWMEISELEQGGVNSTINKTFTNQLQFVFEPVKDWFINVEGSMRNFFSKFHHEVLRMYEYNADGKPVLSAVGWTAAGYTEAKQERSVNDYYQFNLITDYSKTLSKHYFKVMAGMNTELYHNDWIYGSGTNLVSDLYPYLSATQDNAKVGDSIAELALAGFFGRINYSFDNRYLLEANLRYDGSSRFVGDRRWGLFPSFSVGWNIANEHFFERLQDQISVLKLRLSWGQLGNNATKSWYPFFQTIPVEPQSSTWLIDKKKQNTAGIPGIVSDLLTWERVESWNIGLDFTALRNRLSGVFNYYNRYTYDMVGPSPTLPGILGTAPPSLNNADLKSYGWELELNWRDRLGDFSYEIGLNLADGLRKILRYNNESETLNDYYTGKVLGEIWGYTTNGIAKTQEEMDEHLKNNRPNWGSKWTAGDIMYADLDGDKRISSGAYKIHDHGDLKVIGNSTPRYTYGLRLNMAYKGLDAGVFLQGVAKRDYWLGGPYFWGAAGGMWQSAVFKEHLDYWTKDNPNAYYPRPIFGDGKNQQVQTRYLQNASYMRVKNLQLGYTLPESLIQRAKLSKVRLFVSVDNAFTFTKLSKVFDPEALGGDWGPGKLYPLQRSVSVGLNVNL